MSSVGRWDGIMKRVLSEFLFSVILSCGSLFAQDMLANLVTVGDPGNQPDKTLVESRPTYGAVPLHSVLKNMM